MQPFYQHAATTLYQGNCLDVLAALPEASMDSVCTDPPYGFSFMEKDWDHEVPGPEYWRAIARVCKPGAMMLAFGGAKTYHRLTCAIEDARWEVRDCLMWLYGQGMPKCGDIGKMIDKSKGAEREVVGSKLDRPGYHLCEGKGDGCYGGGKGLHAPGTDARLRASQITAPATPEAARWTGWAMALKPAWEPIVLAMKPLDGTIAHNALAWGVAGLNIDASRIACEGGSPSQQRRQGAVPVGNYNGWNVPSRNGYGDARPGEATGRWPANLLLDEEAGKLLDEQSGVTSTTGKRSERSRNAAVEGTQWGVKNHRSTEYPGDKGGASRFFYCSKASRNERNTGCEKVVTWDDVDLSQETDELLQHAKAMSAIGTPLLGGDEWNTMLSGSSITGQSRTAVAFTMSTLTKLITELGTSNFSRSLNTSASILAATRTLLATGSSLADVADSIGQLGTSTSGAMASALSAAGAALRVLAQISAKGKRGNIHPCVKPLALMEYLLTLLSTPTGGVVLDPFAGSGTTLVAAKRLGRPCIGVELDAHNCEIAQARISQV